MDKASKLPINDNHDFLCPDCWCVLDFDVKYRKHKCPECGNMWTFRFDIDNRKLRVYKTLVVPITDQPEMSFANDILTYEKQ